MQNEDQIKALLELINKEPAKVAALTEKLAQLIKAQPQAARRALAQVYGEKTPLFISDIINNIHREELEKPFAWYFGKHNPELLPGAVLIARFINPGAESGAITAPFEDLKNKLAAQLDNAPDIQAKAEVFESFIFGALRFKLENLTADAGLLSLPDIIKTRKTTVFAMAVLYTLLARALDMWADICDAGGKPVVRLRDSATFEPVYVDISARGRHADEAECYAQAASRGQDWDGSAIEPMDNKQIIKRLLANLIYVYSRGEGAAQTEVLRRITKSVF